MSKRLVMYCEGQTEEMVVNRLLRPHLALCGVKTRPILAANSTLNPDGQRGGFVNWDAIEVDLKSKFSADPDPNLHFTTLLDVFRMPKKVLELAGFTAPVSSAPDIEKVEAAIFNVFQEPRFKPYLQRHEFEALLLADCDALANVFHRHAPGIEKLKHDISSFANTEDINHGNETHPAARLANAIPDYEHLKASNAYFVLAQATLGCVRAKNPRFHAWLEHWEKWGGV
jgi:hypothetical protein